jgi:hypothetical protein
MLEWAYLLHCECGDPACERTLRVHEDEYLLARRRRGHVVAADHVRRQAERKISYCGDVCVVVPRHRAARVIEAREAIAA